MAEEQAPAPAEQPAPPPPPDPGVDLLGQAFAELGARNEVLLAAKVGGGIARINALLMQVAQLEVKAKVFGDLAERQATELAATKKRVEELEATLAILAPAETPASEPPAPEAPPSQ